MTLIVGLLAKNGIVITSDSRMTSGDASLSATQSNDTVRKIFKITDHCGVAISGSGEMGVTLIEEFQKFVNTNSNIEPDVQQLAEIFRTICMTKFGQWFSRLPADSQLIPSFNILLCGYEKAPDGSSIPKILRINSVFQFAPMTTTTGFATLGIPTIANYLLNRLYVRDDITVEQALSLGAFCVAETSSQDGRVGGKLQAATFSDVDIFRELEEKEINQLNVRCNEILRNSLQLSLYKESPKEEPIVAIVEGVENPQTDAVQNKTKGK
jgi:20S proteasome alpha/beta subunit